MFPYWELDNPYWLFSVKMVLAAGNVTKTMPCTRPAALMTVRSVFEAICYLRSFVLLAERLALVGRITDSTEMRMIF
jgi:hypothetical protein